MFPDGIYWEWIPVWNNTFDEHNLYNAAEKGAETGTMLVGRQTIPARLDL